MQSSGVFILLKMFASSANNSILQGEIIFDIVFIKILNKSDERYAPWCTPDVAFTFSDLLLLLSISLIWLSNTSTHADGGI